MGELDKETLYELRNGLSKYFNVFKLTRAEQLLIQDAWMYSIGQAEMPNEIKNDGVEE